MALELNLRDFDLFLSHAHKDQEFVAELRRWLKEKAGLAVWFDDDNLDAGEWVSTGLLEAMRNCRGCLLVLTEESSKRRFVQAEYKAAMNEFVSIPGFRIVVLRLAGAPVDPSMENVTWIDVPKPELDVKTASKILRALYPDPASDPTKARDVYISCSWKESDGTSARTVSQHLVKEHNLRLIGDAKDQKGFDPAVRLERIMSSCGAFVAIVPFRGKENASSTQDPYQYMLQEIDLAKSLNLPSIVIADPRVRRTDGDDGSWVRMDTTATQCPAEVEAALADLSERWSNPRKPHYIFCALDLDKAQSYEPLIKVIKRVTAMEAVVKVDETPIHENIARKLREALLVVADISGNNVNRCVEAGIAYAAGVKVELVGEGERRELPFMLRAMTPKLEKTYKDDVDQIGVIHRIVRPYRRRVINAEL